MFAIDTLSVLLLALVVILAVPVLWVILPSLHRDSKLVPIRIQDTDIRRARRTRRL